VSSWCILTSRRCHRRRHLGNITRGSVVAAGVKLVAVADTNRRERKIAAATGRSCVRGARDGGARRRPDGAVPPGSTATRLPFLEAASRAVENQGTIARQATKLMPPRATRRHARSRATERFNPALAAARRSSTDRASSKSIVGQLPNSSPNRRRVDLIHDSRRASLVTPCRVVERSACRSFNRVGHRERPAALRQRCNVNTDATATRDRVARSGSSSGVLPLDD